MHQVFPEIVRYLVMVLGNTFDSHKTFMDHLTISPKLREVSLVKDSDVIIAFVPIVSRAGTDIAAAMEKIPHDKPVVLVVLHHTFNPDYIAPDSRYCVSKDRVFAVDCLFHEDKGLLGCLCNDDAIRAVKKHLRSEDRMRDDFRWNFTTMISKYHKMICVWVIIVAVLVTIFIISAQKSSKDSIPHNTTQHPKV